VAAQVAELVAEDAAPDEGLHPHVAGAHAQVVAPSGVGAPVLLDEDCGSSHFQETAPIEGKK